MWPIVTHACGLWSTYLSVCWSQAKALQNAKPIQMPFAVWTREGLRNLRTNVQSLMLQAASLYVLHAYKNRQLKQTKKEKSIGNQLVEVYLENGNSKNVYLMSVLYNYHDVHICRGLQVTESCNSFSLPEYVRVWWCQNLPCDVNAAVFPAISEQADTPTSVVAVTWLPDHYWLAVSWYSDGAAKTWVRENDDSSWAVARWYHGSITDVDKLQLESFFALQTTRWKCLQCHRLWHLALYSTG